MKFADTSLLELMWPAASVGKRLCYKIYTVSARIFKGLNF